MVRGLLAMQSPQEKLAISKQTSLSFTARLLRTPINEDALVIYDSEAKIRSLLDELNVN